MKLLTADVDVHQLSIGIIGYRSALFSGDGFDSKLTIVYTYDIYIGVTLQVRKELGRLPPTHQGAVPKVNCGHENNSLLGFQPPAILTL